MLTRAKKTYTEDVPQVKSFVADKTQEVALKEIFSNQKFDIVIDAEPRLETIDGVYKYARGLKHYIHCSSTGGYAPLPFIPCNETAYYEGFTSGWKTRKKVVDNKVLDLFNHEGFPATVIRPCYITGGGLLPLDNMGGRREEFIPDIIAGKELDLPNDGQSLLQPVHVKDLARSFYLAAQVPRKSTGQVYNICLEKAVPLNRYLEITAHVFDRVPNINYMPLESMLEKYGDTINVSGLRFLATHMSFDISKAKDQLNYCPAHTSEEAIEETAFWTAKKKKLL